MSKVYYEVCAWIYRDPHQNVEDIFTGDDALDKANACFDKWLQADPDKIGSYGVSIQRVDLVNDPADKLPNYDRIEVRLNQEDHLDMERSSIVEEFKNWGYIYGCLSR